MYMAVAGRCHMAPTHIILTDARSIVHIPQDAGKYTYPPDLDFQPYLGPDGKPNMYCRLNVTLPLVILVAFHVGVHLQFLFIKP